MSDTIQHDLLCHGWAVAITRCPVGSYGRPCDHDEPHGPHHYPHHVILLDRELTVMWCPGKCDGSCAGGEVDLG